MRCNGCQFKNPDISGAFYTFRIQYLHTQIQCEDVYSILMVNHDDIDKDSLLTENVENGTRSVLISIQI